MLQHLAIIPDGNRRWAIARGREPTFGHYISGDYDKLMKLFKEARKLGIKYISIWTFSTDNWTRRKKEIKELFNLMYESINKFRKAASENKICFRHIGRKDRLPRKLIYELVRLESETSEYKDFHVQICLDYGGKDEILRAIHSFMNLDPQYITEETFSKHLDTAGIPDIDLIIRTSCEKRLSGFMPFQSTYAELYFTRIHFPDFGPKHLRRAVIEFQKRKRRFGV